jgi:hypothetical protein
MTAHHYVEAEARRQRRSWQNDFTDFTTPGDGRLKCATP